MCRRITVRKARYRQYVAGLEICLLHPVAKERNRCVPGRRIDGSIGSADIARAVTESGLPLTKKEIRLPQGPLREIGEHEVQLHLHPEVDAPLKIVIAREAERPVSD